MADEQHKPRRSRLRHLYEHQAEEDAPGMRARKYVAMAIVAVSAASLAIRIGWHIHTGDDGKMGPVVALPFALASGTAVAVIGCLSILSSAPRLRLRYSMLFLVLGVLAWWYVPAFLVTSIVTVYVLARKAAGSTDEEGVAPNPRMQTDAAVKGDGGDGGE